MAGKLTFAALVLAVVAAAALLEVTAATVHTVGGSTGWTIPSGSAFYSNWASNQNYAVGDTLVFNFPAGAHDVAQVTKAAYDSCSSTSPISLNANPPVNVTLSTSGQHYFICTFGQHCTSGQKLAVNVLATSGSPPAAAPSPSTAAPTPSPAQTPTPTPSPAQSPTPTPSPMPSAATPAPASAPTPSPTAQPPAPSSETPANSPPPPSAADTPTESNSPTGSTTPPPPPGSSAPRTVAAAFGMVVMSVALAALF